MAPSTAARVFADLLRVPDPITRALVPLVLHPEQQRVIAAWDAIGPDGLPAFDEISLLWIKKSGKSSTAAGLVLAELVGGREPDREIIIVASDLQQSKDVTYAAACRFVRRHPWLSKAIKIGAAELVYKETRTDPVTGGRHVEDHIVRAVPARDAKSLHGSNASLTVFDELWAQSDYAVIEALTRSAGRRAPRVLYCTYAGLKSQARAGNPAFDLWQRWKAGDDPRLFVSFIGGPDGWRSVPWITSRLIESERRRFAAVPSKFTRLYENQWATGDEGSFLSAEEIRDATDAALDEPPSGMGHTYSMGVDLGLTHDLTGLVVSHVDGAGRLIVDVVRTWRGTKQKPVDLMAVEREILDLARRFRIVENLHLDAWQGALLQQRLSRQGVHGRVHTIESSKLDVYASMLKAVFQSRQIRVPAVPELIEQLESLEGQELTRRDRTRFTATGSAHDDLAVALCLSTESHIRWRTKGGEVRGFDSRIGRAQMAEIPSCRIGRDFDCPLDAGSSAHSGCNGCAAYTSAVRARDAHLAAGHGWLSLAAFVSRHMEPCRWLLNVRLNRWATNL